MVIDRWVFNGKRLTNNHRGRSRSLMMYPDVKNTIEREEVKDPLKIKFLYLRNQTNLWTQYWEVNWAF